MHLGILKYPRYKCWRFINQVKKASHAYNRTELHIIIRVYYQIGILMDLNASKVGKGGELDCLSTRGQRTASSFQHRRWSTGYFI